MQRENRRLAKRKDRTNILGFPNASFFGKYVKQQFGMPPLEYRRKAVGKQEEKEG